MVAPVRPIIRLFDEDFEKPDDFVEPKHDPQRVAFVPYSTGLLANEMMSYLEWLSLREEFSWMNEHWDYIGDLYNYWPFMVNSARSPLKSSQFTYHPTTICVIIRVSDNRFYPEGVVALDGPPDLELADQIEDMYPSSDITSLNLAIVPLEMLDCLENVVMSAMYYWWLNFPKMDLRKGQHRLDTVVYWSNATRERFNSLLEGTPVNEDIIRDTDHLVSEEEAIETFGLPEQRSFYFDPVLSSMFMGDLRSRMPELPDDVEIIDILLFFRTGDYMDRIGYDPETYHKLNAILCKYPDEIQIQLASGAILSLNPQYADTIGAGFKHGAEPTREGRILLSYEELRQPRP